MTETRKTITYVGAAVVLSVLALLTAPRDINPNVFDDQGEAFYPEFTDPNSARTLEVISFDEATGSAAPFKVTFKNGRWTIPSHHDHPADGKDRLAQTAAGVIELKKDDLRSDNVTDHEACGVVDPLDDSATSLKGRGQRVTIKGDNEVVLSDVIIGYAVEGRENVRFVRIPGQKRVYASVVDIELSTKFSDWIEADLLQVDKDKIDKIKIHDYSINESTGQLDERDIVTLDKNEAWEIDKVTDGMEFDNYKVNQIVTTLDDLKIEGVRPKPDGLTASLTRTDGQIQISQSDMLSLQSKGYYFTRDGRLVSNEGEIQAETNEGLIYTLRFGEILYGSGVAVSAGGEQVDEAAPGENRYLFLTVTYDLARFPEPPMPSDVSFLDRPDSVWTDADRENKALYDAHDKWVTKTEVRQGLADELNARFARWYYVISAESFDKLRLTRADLMREKKT